MQVREAEQNEIDALARIWYDEWRDAHLALVPEELARIRTIENFTERLPHMLVDTRVVGPAGAPLGFATIQQDELYQLFVSAEARGKGVAKLLIEDAEARLAGRGYAIAWLACAIGNVRAARFYEKSGWYLARSFVSELPIPGGIFKLEVWRYEKQLRETSESVL